MTPQGPYVFGTQVHLEVRSTCGTVKFNVAGIDKAEIGSTNQTETWKTNETGVGSIHVCALARGDGGWDNGPRICYDVYVGPENRVNSYNPPSNDNSGSFNSNGTSNQQNCNSKSRLYIGAIAVVNDVTPDAVPLRSGFGPSYPILIQIPIREPITIIGGPECSGNTVWWESQYRGQTGWVMEITSGGGHDLILNGEPLGNSSGNSSNNDDSSGTNNSESDSNSDQCYKAMSPILSVGDHGQVALEDNIGSYIQAQPAQSPDLLYLDEGDPFEVVGGPTCADGFRWWQVSTQSVVGWIAEGDERGYWLSTTVPEVSVQSCEDLVPDTGMVWLSGTQYAQLLQEYEQLEEQALAELGIRTWITEEHVAEPVAESVVEWIGRRLKLDGRRFGIFVFDAKDFLFGSNADQLVTLERIRTWKARLIQEESYAYNQQGQCRQISAVIVYEKPATSFGYFWLGALDDFPYAQLIECYRHPETCSSLLSLFSQYEPSVGGGGSW